MPDSVLGLELDAKRQKLKKRLKLFATATAESTLVARSKAIKRTGNELAANERTKLKVKLKRAKRKRLARRLAKKGRAKVKVKATATDQSGSTAEDKVRVRLKD